MLFYSFWDCWGYCFFGSVLIDVVVVVAVVTSRLWWLIISALANRVLKGLVPTKIRVAVLWMSWLGLWLPSGWKLICNCPSGSFNLFLVVRIFGKVIPDVFLYEFPPLSLSVLKLDQFLPLGNQPLTLVQTGNAVSIVPF